MYFFPCTLQFTFLILPIKKHLDVGDDYDAPVRSNGILVGVQNKNSPGCIETNEKGCFDGGVLLQVLLSETMKYDPGSAV